MTFPLRRRRFPVTPILPVVGASAAAPGISEAFPATGTYYAESADGDYTLDLNMPYADLPLTEMGLTYRYVDDNNYHRLLVRRAPLVRRARLSCKTGRSAVALSSRLTGVCRCLVTDLVVVS